MEERAFRYCCVVRQLCSFLEGAVDVWDVGVFGGGFCAGLLLSFWL